MWACLQAKHWASRVAADAGPTCHARAQKKDAKCHVLHSRPSPSVSRLGRILLRASRYGGQGPRPTAWAITPARRMQPRGRANSPSEPVPEEDETSILHRRPSPRRRGSLGEFALPRGRSPMRGACDSEVGRRLRRSRCTKKMQIDPAAETLSSASRLTRKVRPTSCGNPPTRGACDPEAGRGPCPP